MDKKQQKILKKWRNTKESGYLKSARKTFFSLGNPLKLRGGTLTTAVPAAIAGVVGVKALGHMYPETSARLSENIFQPLGQAVSYGAGEIGKHSNTFLTWAAQKTLPQHQTPPETAS